MISTWPAFHPLTEHVPNMGCDLGKWTVRLGDNGWYFDMDELKAMIQDNTRLLVINFPHNPTGFVPDQKQYDELIELCKSRGIFLFSDEVYRFSKHDGSPELSAACDIMEDAVSLGGLSKVFAMPGLRVGWLCTRNDEVTSMMHRLKGFLVSSSPGPCETLALIAIRNRQKILQRSRDIISKNLPLLDKFFTKHSDVFTWYRPTIGTVAWVEVKGNLLTLGKGGASGLAEISAKEAKVNLVSSDYFDVEDRFLRIGFGKKGVPKGLEHFDEFVGKYK